MSGEKPWIFQNFEDFNDFFTTLEMIYGIIKIMTQFSNIVIQIKYNIIWYVVSNGCS